jgi:hypothetical protein
MHARKAIIRATGVGEMSEVGPGWGGAVRGECGGSVESFCLRGRSAYVGFSWLLLLAPVRGGTSFLQTRKETLPSSTRIQIEAAGFAAA